mgnify:CR=1 FL=1
MEREIHVLFGTQTGTTEMIASDVEDSLVAASMTPNSVRGLDEIEPGNLSNLGTVLVVCSTYGDGGMPDNAQTLFEKLCSEDAPDLSGLRFSILALGDSSYADFCAAGRKLDEQLAKLGAERIYQRTDCDMMYEDAAEAWTNGVIQVLAKAEESSESNEVMVQSAPQPIHVYFGTQTGTTEMVASDIEDALVESGLIPEVVAGLDEISPNDLSQPTTVLIICSTYGDGDVPDNTQIFYSALVAADAPQLDHIQYSVLAFGDSSYADFCAGGRKLDARIAELGAKRIHDLVKCDMMYEDAAETWTKGVISAISQSGNEATAPAKAAVPTLLTKDKLKWTRINPYPAKVMDARLLSKPCSAKEIMHYTLDLGDDGPRYEVGDTLNVIAQNDPALVAQWLARTKCDSKQAIAGHNDPLEVLLTKKFEISVPSRDLIEFVERRAGDEELSRLISNGDREALNAWLWGKDALDLMGYIPHQKLDADDFTTLFRPLLHRSYSIASSAKLNPRLIDLTVSTVRYENNGRCHGGVASTMLSDRIAIGERIDVFVTPNNSFRVPQDPTVPMIMVGPGTGVAPFRGFLQERLATGAKGMNWLFFGDQTRAHDFIYEDEMVAFLKESHLERLDLAFSRDQNQKIYVQDRMLESSADLFSALETGGYIYVCGDATRMAGDVDETLHKIIANEGRLDSAGARAYVDALKKEKRYIRDVY